MRRAFERRDALRGDGGATAVEFALIAPVLALLIIGFIDFSLVIAGNNAGSNAVRDGARVGVIDFVDADVAGSTNRQAIEAAVAKRIGGLVKGDYTVSVRCLRAGDLAVIPCKVPDDAGPSGVNLDVDLLEVRLDWKQIAITPFARTNHTETIRMTITGRPDFSLDPTPLSVYFDDPDRDGTAAPVTVDEPNGSGATVTVDVILRRSGNSLPTVTVSLRPFFPSSNAAQAADFSFPLTATFASGVDQITVPVTIVDDALVEADETFGVELYAMTTTPAVADAVVGLPDLVLITIRSLDVDTTPPGLLGAGYFETGTRDGRVDEIRVRFDETLGTLGSWSLSGPPGTTMGTVSLGADNKTVVIQVLGGSANTGAAFTVTGSGVKDPQGNTTNPGTVVAADNAGPVLLSVTSTDGDHLAETGDTLRFTFSEPVNVGAITKVTISKGASGPDPDLLTIPGLLATSSTGNSSYITNGGKTADFAVAAPGSPASLFTLTLGACSGDCNKLNAPTGATPTLGLVLDAAVNGVGGPPAVASPLTGFLF